MRSQTAPLCSRRQFINTAGGAVIFRRQLFAENDGSRIVETMLAAAAKAKIEIRPIRRNISVLDGSGGNIAVLTGKDGKLLVDAGYTASKTEVASALATLGSDAIRHLINTHWHTDHTDGNAWLRGSGAAIVVTCPPKTHPVIIEESPEMRRRGASR